MTVRSVRNRNPGNIRIGQPWRGLLPPDEMTPEQKSETSFCVFRSPAFGFRALALLLLTYFRKYKLRTIYSIISRFAPSNENDTKAYAKAVSNALNVPTDAPINLEDEHTLTLLCKAISIHEAGGWLFTQADLESGIDMALGRSSPSTTGVSV